MNNPPHAPQPFGNLGVAHHPAARPALPPLVVRWAKFALSIFVLTFITMVIQDVVALMLKPSRGSRAPPAAPRVPPASIHASGPNSSAPLGVPSNSFVASPLAVPSLPPSLSIQCEKIVIVMGGERGEDGEDAAGASWRASSGEEDAGARTWWESSEAGGKTRRKSFKRTPSRLRRSEFLQTPSLRSEFLQTPSRLRRSEFLHSGRVVKKVGTGKRT